MVVGVDLTEYAEIVLEHALDQAARHDAPELHFLYVEEHTKRSRRRAGEELKQRLAAIVSPSLQTFNPHGTNWRARLHVRAGKPEEQIAMLAQDIRSDLIVIGHFGVHHRKQTLKSIPGRVLLAAPCATLVVGMPYALDAGPQCNACVAVRDRSDGERWFCEAHSSARRTPMTTCTGGSLLW